MVATSANTGFAAHFVRQNFGYAETSYMLEPLSYSPSLYQIYRSQHPNYSEQKFKAGNW